MARVEPADVVSRNDCVHWSHQTMNALEFSDCVIRSLLATKSVHAAISARDDKGPLPPRASSRLPVFK